jgi:hypothetical protein
MQQFALFDLSMTNVDTLHNTFGEASALASLMVRGAEIVWTQQTNPKVWYGTVDSFHMFTIQEVTVRVKRTIRIPWLGGDPSKN